jgi:hypothetical protein
MRPGVTIVAINAAPFTRETLVAAVRAAGSRPIVLTIDQDGRRSDRAITYAGTLRYPRLERIAGQADTLSPLLTPR